MGLKEADGRTHVSAASVNIGTADVTAVTDGIERFRWFERHAVAINEVPQPHHVGGAFLEVAGRPDEGDPVGVIGDLGIQLDPVRVTLAGGLVDDHHWRIRGIVRADVGDGRCA